MTRFVLRQALDRTIRVSVGRNRSGQRSVQRSALILCALVLGLVTLWGNLPAFARYEQRRVAQVSPLETPITVTNSAIITGSLNAPTSPLTHEMTTESITEITVAITSVTTTAINTATLPTTNTVPIVEAPTVDLVNQGQASLWLVGAVLVGLLVVVGVVIGRQRA